MRPIVDGHLDLAWNAVGFERDLLLPIERINERERGCQDSRARGSSVVSLAEMRRGQVTVCFATLLARAKPGRILPPEGARRIDLDHGSQTIAHCMARAHLAWYEQMAHRNQLRFIRTVEDLDTHWACVAADSKSSPLGIVLAMEGADPVTEVAELDDWFLRGLRQINLVHYGENRYAAGTGAKGGLSADGRSLLRRCERLGIALDTTHLAHAAFFEALDAFAGPVLASHQNCQALVPGDRQFTDEQLRLLLARNAVVGVALDNWMLAENWKAGISPRSAVTLENVADHIDHLCQLAGDHLHVALGTDLDGGFGNEQAPNEVHSIADVQILAEVLAKRRYSSEAIDAVFHGNWIRWLREHLPRADSDNNVQRANERETIHSAGVPPMSVHTGKSTSVLIVGVGSIGERHLRCFQQTGRATLAVCELNEELRESVSDRYGIDRRHATLAAALATPPAVVVLATPAHLHVEMALEAVDRGCHVLIEKPLSTSTAGTEMLLERVTQRKLVAAVAYVLRCHPALSAARDAVWANRFGKPLQVVVVSGQHFPFYRPAYRDTYYRDHAKGGGAIQDALTHFINTVEGIAGPMSAVMADAAHLALDGVEVEDTVHVLARHGKTLASYALNQHQAPNESTITIVCEGGTVRVSLAENYWAFQQKPQDTWSVQRFADLARDDLFIRQANVFLDAIEGRARPLCNLEEAMGTLDASLAVLQCSQRPQWLELSNRKPSAAAV